MIGIAVLIVVIDVVIILSKVTMFLLIFICFTVRTLHHYIFHFACQGSNGDGYPEKLRLTSLHPEAVQGSHISAVLWTRGAILLILHAPCSCTHVVVVMHLSATDSHTCLIFFAILAAKDFAMRECISIEMQERFSPL